MGGGGGGVGGGVGVGLGWGVNTNAYKYVQGGRGGGSELNMTKNTHFVRRFIENATISETIMIDFTYRKISALPTSV